MLFEYHKTFGNKWSEISKHLPGRTDNSIKNQFYSSIRRNLRKLNRERPENQKITGSIKSILKNQELAKLILLYPENLRIEKPKSKMQNIGNKKSSQIIHRFKKFNDTPSILHRRVDNSLKINKKDRPIPIVLPSPKKSQENISEISNLENFTPSKMLASITPTSFVKSTPLNSARFFKFPDENGTNLI